MLIGCSSLMHHRSSYAPSLPAILSVPSRCCSGAPPRDRRYERLVHCAELPRLAHLLLSVALTRYAASIAIATAHYRQHGSFGSLGLARHGYVASTDYRIRRYESADLHPRADAIVAVAVAVAASRWLLLSTMKTRSSGPSSGISLNRDKPITVTDLSDDDDDNDDDDCYISEHFDLLNLENDSTLKEFTEKLLEGDKIESRVEKVCAKAVSDPSVDKVTRALCSKLYTMSAALSPWGERVNCAVIAGLLLYEAGKQDQKLSTTAAQYAEQQTAEWFATLMLGDDDYKGHRKWVQAYLKRAYLNLVAKMEQSQVLAEEGARVLMQSDSAACQKAKGRSGTTNNDDDCEDFKTRVLQARTTAEIQFPLSGGSAFRGISLYPYQRFRRYVSEFLAVYKELCILGEVVCTDPCNGITGKPVYYVRGSINDNWSEKSLESVSKQLFLLKKRGQIIGVVNRSYRNRVLMEQQGREKQSGKARAAATKKRTATAKHKKTGRGKRARKAAPVAAQPLDPLVKAAGQRVLRSTRKKAESSASPPPPENEEGGAGGLEPTPDFQFYESANPKPWHLGVVLLKPGEKVETVAGKPPPVREVVANPDSKAKNKIDRLVTVENASRMYMDFSSLTENVHEGGGEEHLESWVNSAFNNRVSYHTIFRGTSTVTHDVNAVYPGTPEYEQFAGDSLLDDFDPGALLEGTYNYVKTNLKKIDSEKAKEMLSRLSIQQTFGACNHSSRYDDKSGEFANPKFQNEKALPFYAGGGRCIGVATKAAATIRDNLVAHRGGKERNNPERNREYTDWCSHKLKTPDVGAEMSTVNFIGNTKTLRELREMLLSRLSPEERKELLDPDKVSGHKDKLNAKSRQYSRSAILSKCGRLKRDNEGEEFRASLILCDRDNVEVWDQKTKGAHKLSAVCVAEWEKYRSEHSRAHEDDGDTLVHAKEIRLGFVDNEPVPDGAKVHEKEKGPGYWLSYERKKGTEQWTRHRREAPQAVGGGSESAEAEELVSKATIFAELVAAKADPNKFSPFSGLAWSIDDLCDHFDLRKTQKLELAYCVLLHTKSPAVFLAKCLYMRHKWSLEKVAGLSEEGAIGSAFMTEVPVPVDKMGRIAFNLARATNFALKGVTEDFTPAFFREQTAIMQEFLTVVEKANKKEETMSHLLSLKKSPIKALKHVGQFAYPQIIPICYLLGLVDCLPLRAAEAPILDQNKAHYCYLTGKLGVEGKHVAQTMLIVAHKHGTHPVKIENTVCEKERQQEDVLDFFVPGQKFYDLRLERGAVGKPQYVVYVKEWGADGVWEKAKKQDGRWVAHSSVE